MSIGSTHTPGPWEYDAESGSVHATKCGYQWTNKICDMESLEYGETTKNATLIAAAPDLLKALRDIEVGANTVDGCYSRNPGNFAAALRDLREYAEAARRTIAKATGSTNHGA